MEGPASPPPPSVNEAVRFKPERIFSTLNDSGVEYVVIGGLAAVLHGSPLRTGDTDVCPSRTQENLSRLADALRRLQAQIHTASEPVRMPFDAGLLAKAEIFNLVCAFGELDITFRPSGTDGYDDVMTDAVFELEGGLVMHVASIDAVIRSKEAADRPKDRAALPTLRILREELRRNEPDTLI